MTTPYPNFVPTIDWAKANPREALEWARKQEFTIEAWGQVEKMRDAQNMFNVALAATEAQRDAAVAACEKGLSKCRCKGTGEYQTDCTLCGDSTFDHVCNDKTVACTKCEHFRAAIALTKGPTP